MKNTYYRSWILSILIFFFIGTWFKLSCFAENTIFGADFKMRDNGSTAETVLKEFLADRKAGNYKDCVAFLSKKFLNEFSKTYKINFIDYYRAKESHYIESKIIKSEKVNKRKILYTVSVIIEEPGIKSKTIECYFMINEADQWKIDEIQYSDQFDIIEVIQEDGRWKKIEN